MFFLPTQLIYLSLFLFISLGILGRIAIVSLGKIYKLMKGQLRDSSWIKKALCSTEDRLIYQGINSNIN